VYALVANSPANGDFRFRDQIKGSASSATSNLAEGFSLYRHKECAPYARTARASLIETLNHLHDGVDRRYWTTEQVAPAVLLANRAAAATMRWIEYLMSTETPASRWQRK